MTHDELSKKLEGLWHDSYKAPGYMMLWNVVKLHKPAFAVVDGVKGTQWCYQCADQRGYAKYPCPTIQAIEKELK